MTDDPQNPSERWQDTEEPSALGAAATLPVTRRTRQERAEQRRARREAPRLAPVGAAVGEGSYSGVEYVFEPHATSARPLREYVGAAWERRRFMVELAKADLRGPRSNTVLGGIWGVLDPLVQAGIYFFLFAIIRGGRGRPIDFLPLLVGGMFLFQLTTGAMTEGGNSLRKNRNLLLNSTLPRAVLPLASVYKHLLRFVPCVAVYVVVHALFGPSLSWSVLLLPPIFAVHLAMNVGLALGVATLVVSFRDASNVLNYVTRLLFFATPVIYPLALLPDGARDVMPWIQPLFPLFATYQQILGGTTPDALYLFLTVVWAMFFLVLGVRVFRRHERSFGLKL